ncbi:hypothetical protein GC093_29350 [Paenibacillus sp. LMG 31456]|uniref:Ferric siderophore reductase C-terminal domain-containing protein n=1 Tax=Paenibacillus foliorum TaxID=2654974 RepID=A0A972GZA3_9BACL|nr:hypothetical protein [Paenibacillus foliorum]NOU97304.1 hypothetical protein [Paenibacillus foliorum]
MNITEHRSWASAYRIFFSEKTEGITFSQKDLDQDSALLLFLNEFANDLQSPALQVTGSLFIKRYCSLIVGAMYGYIRNREAIDLTPNGVTLVWKDKTLQFVIDSLESPSFLSGLTEEEQKERYFDHVFADQAETMLRRVAQLTGIDIDTLWGTLSYSLAYWIQEWLKSSSLSEAERKRIEDDYSEILGTFRQERFPNMLTNPVTGGFRSVDNPLDTHKPISVRSKCCLYYCLPSSSKYCYTCPRITDEKRIEYYGEIHEIRTTN